MCGNFVNLFNFIQLYKTIIAKISIGMVVQNSTRTMVVGKITDKVYPMPFFSKNRVSVKKCQYHNVLFAVVLASNIISSGVTT